MKIGIIYESKTGNTKEIAEAIKDSLQGQSLIFENVEDALTNEAKDDIDLYFLGSWTDKGNCGSSMKAFSKEISGKKVALFGTAGFGGSEEYFEDLANRFEGQLGDKNEILGSFYCQGKMPMGIRNRYVSMLQENPEDKKLIVNVENFDKAQSHPDGKDINNAKQFAKDILKKM